MGILLPLVACDTATAEPTVTATETSEPIATVTATATPTQVATATPINTIPKPSAAVLVIDGNEQVAGIGTYCWMIGERGLCADYLGVITPKVLLEIESPVTATLRLPITQAPSRISLTAIQVSDADEMKADRIDERIWYAHELEGQQLMVILSAEQKVDIDLSRGLQVLNLMTAREGYGDVVYGFLIDVK
ncbi:MAG: hypothetical protein EXR59_03015 [Dehalococcoidia bacterium]|nr:hypothetical protein [Dehalococcoidia bacterium]